MAGTYGLADDVKLARRAVHKGDPAACVLPQKKAEVAQLLGAERASDHGSDIDDADALQRPLRGT